MLYPIHINCQFFLFFKYQIPLKVGMISILHKQLELDMESIYHSELQWKGKHLVPVQVNVLKIQVDYSYINHFILIRESCVVCVVCIVYVYDIVQGVSLSLFLSTLLTVLQEFQVYVRPGEQSHDQSWDFHLLKTGEIFI